MKILQINSFKFNNNTNKAERTGLNSLLPQYGMKLKPQIQRDTVSFTAKLKIVNIPSPTFDETIKSIEYTNDQCSELLKLAKFGIPCPACGHIMLDWDKYSEFEKKITYATTPRKIIEYMDELKQYLHPTEAKIFEIMKSENQKNPQKTLHAILKSYLPESEKRLVELQSQILAYIGILSRDLPSSEYKNVRILLQETFARLIDPRETSRFSRKIFISKLRDIFIPDNVKDKIRLLLIDEYFKNNGVKIKNTDEYVNNRLIQVIQNWEYTPEQEKILEVASKLPKADNLDAFIVKYSKRNYKRNNPDKQIALRMLSNSLVTAEHIIPESKGGKTESKNIALECASCNNGRSSDSIITQIAENPTMPVNYRKYIKRLYQLAQKKLIDEGCIKAQNQTYKEQSLGILDLNAPIAKKKERVTLKNCKDYDTGITPTKQERRAARKAKIKKKKKPKTGKK